MYYYKTTVRLDGNTMNEVRKIVSAPEFLILQLIHGTDALVGVEEIKNEVINFAAEKDRLKGLYEMALVKNDQTIDSIFGAFGQLPERLPAELRQRFNLSDDGLTLIDLTKGDIGNMVSTAKGKNPHSSVKSAEEIEREQRVVPSEEVNVADLIG